VSRPRSELPIWLRPEPAGRKPRFSREAIARAALAIADEDGFDAVSMRRIAEKLGAGTMTLYYYVHTKADLIALMDDELMGEILVPVGTLPRDWRAALAAIARRTRDVFRRHPWALLAMQGAVPGPNGARHFEQCLEALSQTPFDRRTKLELLALVDDFVFGHTLRAAEAHSTLRQDADQEVRGAIRAWALEQYEKGALPHTRVFFGQDDPEKAIAEVAGIDDDEGRFERGLATLLDGVAKEDRARRPPTASRRAPASGPKTIQA
jgi:AcrR family transcriptional regulator